MNRATPPSRATTKAFADPFAIHNAAGNGGVVLLCEHASSRVPAHYRGMGLSREQQQRHIAWDVGVLAVAMTLSSVLAAPLVHDIYSRLLLDLNRPLAADDSIVIHSEGTAIPGDRRSTSLHSNHQCAIRMPSSDSKQNT